MKQPFYLISEDDIKALAEQISANIQNKLEGNFTPIVSSKTSDDEFLNIEELTKLIGLTKPTIYGHVHRNTIPYIKKGKMLRFSKLDILHWLENGKNNSKSDLEAKVNEYLAKKPLFNR
ncbi:helix-turn-helix domain-containing protein [Flavobacterium sp. NRK F7]|uniref:helix-turn-helix domain-containing protein n=1 Tax=Flavobacterium sp. NRK F7 TaxID=2954930 RepID=UPI002090BB73|nr:helix-turn-helix domain-containing protein [Flavobacterium sp. NRK F7]MCO6164505.1 helix-turn-helix domain-containing protein [Flavobacterium sp. NRK F7]